MGRVLGERELRRRALASIRAEVEALGSGAPDPSLIRRDGLLAAVVPAAPPEHRGRGIAGWLMARALAAARDDGASSASLRASSAASPLYGRLGFRDGFVVLWELRR